jgi:hypothetical protein
MEKRKTKKSTKKQNECTDVKCNCKPHGSMGGFYFLGFLGSAIYFIQQSSGFWQGVLGFLKAIVWPVFLVYHLFGV